MRSMQFKTTIGSGGIPTPQRMDVPPGIGRGGNVITYRVTDIPEGVGMAAVRNLLAQTAVHGVYIIPYEQLGPGRIVKEPTT